MLFKPIVFKICVALSTFSVIISAAPSSTLVALSDAVPEINPSVDNGHALASNSLHLRNKSPDEHLKTSRDIHQ
jgi:hypothetical protein